MSKVSVGIQIESSGNSPWTKLSVSVLGLLITIAYFPLELGLGLIRTSIPILLLAGILVLLTKSFQKVDSIDIILLTLSFWITLILVIFPTVSSITINWNLYLGEVGSLVAGGLTRQLCRKFSAELIRGLACGLIVQVFIGVYQVLVGPKRLNALGYVYPKFIFEPGGGFSRAFGSFFNPVVYGSFIAVLGIGLCNYYTNQQKKFVIIALLATFAIIVSETRGALIAFLIGIFLLIIKVNKTQKRFSLLISGYALIIGVIVVMLFAGSSDLVNRNVSRISSIQDAATDQSVIVRKEMWQESSSLISKSPITGGGTKFLLGDFEYSTPLLQYFKHPHSTYFFVALVYGIFPGLILFLLLLWKLAKQTSGMTVIAVFMTAGATETIWSSVNMMVLVILLSEITEKK
jgi:O-antigen ligase